MNSFAFLDIDPAILSSFLNIYEPDDDTRSSAQSEQEWKSHPVVIGVVDNRLNDVWAEDRRLVVIIN